MTDPTSITDIAGEASSQDGPPSAAASAPGRAVVVPSSRLALDIGGTLIKLVYFSREEPLEPTDGSGKQSLDQSSIDQPVPGKFERSLVVPGGKLHFLTFETRKLDECLNFISSKQLHHSGTHLPLWRLRNHSDSKTTLKATGGGAYKYADVFKKQLGVILDKEDEMDCLVAGTHFSLKTTHYEAFTHMKGKRELVKIDQNDLFPYLLVNIGSGASMIKVGGEGEFQRVSGTCLGGGTFLGLGRLLTKCESFDDLLELSQRGDNSNVDMLIGDLDGCLDLSKIGLSATAIASSFGKTTSKVNDLSDYKCEDIALALLLMIAYNVGQISYLVAGHYGIRKIIFDGLFIRGNVRTMDALSFAVHFWSKGQAKALFLQNEGFLGVLGAFMSYETDGLGDLMSTPIVKEYPMDSYVNEQTNSLSLGNVEEKATNPENSTQNSQKELGKIEEKGFSPHLLVNIGSTVNMIKVDGHGKFQHVIMTTIGGGTYWGLGRLLTKCKRFDDLLVMSKQGNNSCVDMLVGDIYGGLDYAKIGLEASIIASSFGKAIYENKEISDYRPEDMSLSLLTMICYNIAQISYFTACEHGLGMIVFCGEFIRGHDYTMETISAALQFWSNGRAQAVFSQHDGVL